MCGGPTCSMPNVQPVSVPSQVYHNLSSGVGSIQASNTVGFESTSLEVSENAGKVEICVRINLPSSVLIQQFNLTVKTRAGTAGQLHSSIAIAWH